MKIEELIRKRRAELDAEEVPVEIWEGISAQRKQPKQHKTNAWKVAATLLLIAVVALLAYNQRLETQVERLASLGDISEKYAVIEANYQHEIRELEASLPISSVLKNDEFKWIEEEIQMLEEVNQLYRKDIGRINSEQLIPTLLDYYEKKIRILKRLELEVRRQSKDNKDETTIYPGTAI